MSILIVPAFVKFRELLATHKDLAARIEKLEAGQRDHAIAIQVVATDVENLTLGVKRELKKLTEPNRRRSRIGFVPGGK